MSIAVRPATLEDIHVVADVIREAIYWLKSKGMPMWQGDAFEPAAIRESIEYYHIAFLGHEAAGVVKLEALDLEFWPEIERDTTLFIHRLAVRRAFAGLSVSSSLLKYACAEAARRNLCFLRLDCAVDRPKLRKVYEDFGFRYHSDTTVGPFTVARYEYKIK
jgi:GNAT superfamily N-acetyltransferase